ncbi:hypothetical protein CPC08DRAFT_704108 [Agrocybe pediades]|nr:hypothetical protein CPC08DRAFT_704108 [Agrocybe pediades]
MVSEDGRLHYSYPALSDGDFVNGDSNHGNEFHSQGTRSPESYESTSEHGSLEENDISRISAKPIPALSGTSQAASAPHQLLPVKPQPTRQRTTQACSKCRERKTKCSGHRPVCLRCSNRGLICEYAQRESRVRAVTRPRQYTAVTPPVTARQPNIPPIDLPTPAIHSRLGGNQTNAFAAPSRNVVVPTSGNPGAGSTSRLYVPNPMQNIQCMSAMDCHVAPAPALEHRATSWHSPPQRFANQGHPTQQEQPMNNRSISSFPGDDWPSSSHSYLPLNSLRVYNEQSLAPLGQSSFQPPYPPLHIPDRERTNFQRDMSTTSITHSSSSEQFDYGISSFPSFSAYSPLPRQNDFGRSQSVQQSNIPPSTSSGKATYPSYTPDTSSTSSFFDTHAPSPFYAQSTSSRSTTTSSHSEVVCPAPSVPIVFNALGETNNHRTFDRRFFNMSLPDHQQDHHDQQNQASLNSVGREDGFLPYT